MSFRALRVAIRSLGRAPSFTLLSVATLALAVAGNGAVFSLVDTILLQPLPLAEAERLVIMRQSRLDRPDQTTGLSYANFAGVAEESQALAAVGAIHVEGVAVTRLPEPVQLMAGKISPKFFRMTGSEPVTGRFFTPEESLPGAPGPVVVISEQIWRGRFGADPDIAGRPLVVDGNAVTVIGVAPASLSVAWPEAEIWLPDVRSISALTPALIERGVRYLGVYARLAEGVTLEQATAEMAVVASHLEQRYPDRNQGMGLHLTPLSEEIAGPSRPVLTSLTVTVALILLIAGVNMANLSLARAAERRRELAVRAALGSGRGRLLGLFMLEGALLGAAGGALGLALATVGLRVLAGQGTATMPRLAEVGLDLRLGLFTATVAVGAGLVVGIASALRVARLDAANVLSEVGRGASAGRERLRLRRTLVAMEIALALAVLTCAGLLGRSFATLAAVDPGFEIDDRLTMEMSLPEASYGTDVERALFARRLVAEVEALPGVTRATVVNHLALAPGDDIVPIDIEGRAPAAPGELTFAYFRSVSPSYFETTGIALRRGRLLATGDGSDAQTTVVVNETFAREIFPGEDPIGRRFALRGLDQTPREVVGVVEDVVIDSLQEPVPAVMYTPFDQLPRASFALVVHAAGGITGLAEPVRQVVRSIDPDRPVFHLQTMRERARTSVARERFQAGVMALFGALAAALAAVGVYGVVAYVGSRRRRELGVRMALGARKAEVLALLGGQAAGPIAFGVAGGLLAATIASRSLATLLFGIGTFDPLSFAGAAVALAAISLIAALIPALRAVRRDPMRSLRHE